MNLRDKIRRVASQSPAPLRDELLRLLKTAGPRTPAWAFNAAEDLEDATGEEFDEPAFDAEYGWVILYPAKRGYTWRVFADSRAALKYLYKALVKKVKEKPGRFSDYLVLDVPDSYVDGIAQDEAHGFVDGLPDEEIARMSEGSGVSLDEAREHLWDQTYEETRENFEADPVGWLEDQGWDVSRGKMPMVIEVDAKATAKALVDSNGFEKFLHHAKGHGHKLSSGALAFRFDDRGFSRGEKL